MKSSFDGVRRSIFYPLHHFGVVKAIDSGESLLANYVFVYESFFQKLKDV